MFCVLPSVNVPVAENCCFVPSAMDGADGVTAIDASMADVTVRMVDPVTDPEVAEIVVLPGPTLVANPTVPATLLIVATPAALDAHCTVPVISCVVASE